MSHLLGLGHRRIAAITGPRGWVATEDRRRGYHAALAAQGILPDPSLEVEADFEIAPGRDAAGHLLDLHDPPTAIFAFNDNLAIGALQAARDRGLRVPGDLSVVGFDDVEPATIVTPTLTTVRQPLAEMGRTAVSLLMRLLERQRFETLRVELATRLVVRESTGPPRSA
jgi:LacI family transcriptional regulator